jgi:hypothetical protein
MTSWNNAIPRKSQYCAGFFWWKKVQTSRISTKSWDIVMFWPSPYKCDLCFPPVFVLTSSSESTSESIGLLPQGEFGGSAASLFSASEQFGVLSLSLPCRWAAAVPSPTSNVNEGDGGVDVVDVYGGGDVDVAADDGCGLVGIGVGSGCSS